MGEVIQNLLIAPDIDSKWAPPTPDQWPSWKGVRRLGIDVETCDPDLKALGVGVRRGAFLAGISISLDGVKTLYFPVAHGGGGNLNKANVIRYFKKEAKKFKGEVVGANLDYDLEYLWEEGIEFHSEVIFRDVQLADALIYELEDRYTLEAVAQRRVGKSKDETLLIEAAKAHGYDPKAELWKLHSKYVGAYAEIDASLPIEILEAQDKLIDAYEIRPVWNMESKLLPILTRMRRRGVRVDLDQMDLVEKHAIAQAEMACAEITRKTGINFTVDDLNKKGALVKLADHENITLPRTPTGQPKLTKEIIAQLHNETFDLVREGKKWAKLKTTYVDGNRKFLIGDRVHCTLNQSVREAPGRSSNEGARFGRLASSRPNLQNQPSKGEIGKLLRRMFIAEEGEHWFCNDFSTQEPRIAVHFAELWNCDGAKIAGDLFRSNPRVDFHQKMADIAKKDRYTAKQLFLALTYGMGGAKLCDSLGLPTDWWTPPDSNKPVRVAGEKGRAIKDAFHREVPWMPELAMQAYELGGQQGYVTTIMGRRCHFPDIPEGRRTKRDRYPYWDLHAALNRIVQGSAADQTKQAIIAVSEAGYEEYVRLQVHDELDGSVPDPEIAREISVVMTEALPLSVPVVADCEIGKNWADIIDIDDYTG